FGCADLQLARGEIRKGMGGKKIEMKKQKKRPTKENRHFFYTHHLHPRQPLLPSESIYILDPPLYLSVLSKPPWNMTIIYVSTGQ
ncbi:hypothetical protein EJB05_06921, partial [Eragrostis curvula]